MPPSTTRGERTHSTGESSVAKIEECISVQVHIRIDDAEIDLVVLRRVEIGDGVPSGDHGHRIGKRGEDEPVRSDTSGETVSSGTPDQAIIPGATNQHVTATITVESVIPRIALDHIVKVIAQASERRSATKCEVLVMAGERIVHRAFGVDQPHLTGPFSYDQT